MQAHITRLMTFAQHGQPKTYAASDMMRADMEALIIEAVRVPSFMKAVIKASQLAEIAEDWNLKEVEIDGEMVDIYDLKQEFLAVLNGVTQ